MNIKRLIIFITIMVFSLGLISCNSARTMVNDRLAELNGSNDDETADKCFQKIIEALDNKDKEELKKIFSPNALKEANDIDSSINEMMNFYKGKMKSNKRTVATSESKDYGENKKELNCSYKVTTDDGNYSIHFVEKLIDTKNPNNVGIYTLDIMKEQDGDKFFHWGNKNQSAGVYVLDIGQ